MAAVPVYGGPQVKQQALDIPVQRPIDVSTGLGKIGEGVSAIGEAGLRINLRDAEAEANQVDQEITKAWLDWDKEARYAPKYQGQGAEAYGADANKWWSDAREKYGASVNNPLARQSIGPSLQKKQNQAMAGVYSHVGEAKQRHAITAYDAAQNTTAEFAIDSGNPESFVPQISSAAAKFGATQGWTTEQVKQEEQKRLAGMHVAYIRSIVDQPGGAQKAQDYFVRNKGQIPLQYEAETRKIIDAELDNAFVNQFTASNAGKPIEEQLQLASAIQDPARQAKAIQKVSQMHALTEASKRAREEAFGKRAWDATFNNRQPSETDLAGMSASDRLQMENFTYQRTQRVIKGETVKTDPDIWAGLIQLSIDDPEAFAKVRVDQLSESLSPDAVASVGRMIKDAQDPKNRRDLFTSNQQLTKAADGAKMNKSERGDFQQAASTEFSLFEEQHKRKPNENERQKIINDMLTNRVLSRDYWFDDERPAWKMTPEELAASSVAKEQPNLPKNTASGTVTAPGAAPAAAPAGTTAAPARTGAQVSPAAANWTKQVNEVAAAKGVNPNVMLAMIDVESGGDPNAVGPMTKYGTAKGLTQFIDSTGAQYGVKPGDPQSAITGQGAYMKDLLAKFGGDYAKAVAAYNTGPGNVDRAIAASPDNWRTQLPAETQKYVTKVLAKAGLSPDGDKYRKGKVRRDASGNYAIYLGSGNWMEIK